MRHAIRVRSVQLDVRACVDEHEELAEERVDGRRGDGVVRAAEAAEPPDAAGGRNAQRVDRKR